MAAPVNYLSSPTLTLSSSFKVPSHFNTSLSYHHINFPISHHLSKHALNFSLPNATKFHTHFTLNPTASTSVGNIEYTVEPATSVKFQKILNLPDCSSSLSLLGTGYKEKVFATIGVKVYAAGLYMNPSLLNDLNPRKRKSPEEVEKDPALFQSIYQSSLEKALQIVLVRDVDGKTFWDALDEAVSPRVTAPTLTDEAALATIRSIFQGRSLKEGTSIILAWLGPSKILVSVSSNGLPSKADATIDSMIVTRVLFDLFFGDSPTSPTLKASVAGGLVSAL